MKLDCQSSKSFVQTAYSNLVSVSKLIFFFLLRLGERFVLFLFNLWTPNVLQLHIFVFEKPASKVSPFVLFHDDDVHFSSVHLFQEPKKSF